MIVPCYKQAGFLAQSVGSALAQAGVRVEVIVVDDESPDDTPQVAAMFGDRIKYIRQKNGGVADARNTGLASATGEFVHFLDADDWLLPDMLQRHIEVMRATNADVTAGGCMMADSTGKFILAHDAPVFEPDPFHALLPFNRAPPVCYLFRRRVVEAVGRFDPDRRLNGHEDWDLLLRIAGSGAKFEGITGHWCAYRDSPGSSSKQNRRMYDTGRVLLSKAVRIHPGCRQCRRLFAESRLVFYDMYFDFVLKRAWSNRSASGGIRATLSHFASRSISDPRLLLHVFKRALRKLGRFGRDAVSPESARQPRPAGQVTE